MYIKSIYLNTFVCVSVIHFVIAPTHPYLICLTGFFFIIVMFVTIQYLKPEK